MVNPEVPMRFGPVRRLALLALACLSLPAQTVYQGALQTIEIIKHPPFCASNLNPVIESPAPVANLPISYTGTCPGTSTKLDVQLTLPLTTSKATNSRPQEITFDEPLRVVGRATATFTHPGVKIHRLYFWLPTPDFAPNPEIPDAAGGCPVFRSIGGPKSGTWSDTVSIDCARKKTQNFGYDPRTRTFTVLVWTAIYAELSGVTSGTTPTPTIYIEVKTTYLMSPVLADKVSITSANPVEGARQDPNGVMSGVANVSYDLGSRDSGVLVLRAYDEKGALLRVGPQKQVQRGSGTTQLSLPQFVTPRSAQEIRWVAELTYPGIASPLARSQEVRYPVDIDLKIDHVEAIQVVQDAANTVRLAAGRPTWLRFYAHAKEANGLIEKVAFQVRAFRGGVEQEDSPMLVAEEATFTGTVIDRHDETVLYQMIPLSWTATGDLELRIEVNPAGTLQLTEKNRADNSLPWTVHFYERPPLDIRYLPICLQEEGAQPKCAAGERFHNDVFHATAVFPMQGGGLSYEPQATRPWVWTEPLVTAGDWDRMIHKLSVELEQAGQPSGPAFQLVGWLPAGTEALLPDGNKLLGLSSPVANGGTGRVQLIAESGPESNSDVEPFAVAHELGHHFGLTHGYPQPACSKSESSLLTGEINILCGQFYNPRHYHLMSPCDLRGGISVAQFNQVWESGFRPAGRGGSPRGAQRRAGAHAGSESNAQCVLVQGRVSRESTAASIEAITQVACSLPLESPEPGEFSLREFDETGAKLIEWPFSVSFTIRESTAPMEERAFLIKAPLEARTLKIALFKGDLEVAARAASPNQPQLSWLAPAQGERWDGGPRDLAWSASDADSDALQFAVLYSPDGGLNWTPVASRISEPRLTIDPKHLMGGPQVLFRVIANDGFHSTQADAGPIEIVQTPAAQIASKQLDFMNVLRGRSRSLQATVRNGGNGPLTVRVTGPERVFSVSDSSAMTIMAGGSRAVEVHFSPPATGNYSATLKLATNDPAQPGIEILLSGQGVDSKTPELEILTPALSFPATAAAKTSTLSLKLRNRGPASLTIRSLTSNSPLFRLGPLVLPKSLPDGATLEVPITFAPTAPGAVTAALTLQTDDPKRPSVEIRLQATASEP